MSKEKLGLDPAFPAENLGQHSYSGMSKRLWIATQLVQGMLAHSTRYKPRDSDKELYWHTAIVKEAYEITDELLKQENNE
jgi:Fe-S cluster biosynthesis and repair protein YggX